MNPIIHLMMRKRDLVEMKKTEWDLGEVYVYGKDDKIITYIFFIGERKIDQTIVVAICTEIHKYKAKNAIVVTALECENYITAPAKNILAQNRKAGLHILIMTNYTYTFDITEHSLYKHKKFRILSKEETTQMKKLYKKMPLINEDDKLAMWMGILNTQILEVYDVMRNTKDYRECIARI